MSAKRLFFVILSIVFSFNSIAQNVDEDKGFMRIQKKMINFLISKGELDDCDTLNTCLSSITVVDIITKEPFDNQKNGVFLFREVNPPSTTFILLIKNRKTRIIDIKHLAFAMKKISSFLIEINIPNEKCELYFQEIISIYSYNGYRYKYRM